MSYASTLVHVGLGLAAAKGLENFNRLGRMGSLADLGAGPELAETMTRMGESLGLGGAKAMAGMMAAFGMDPDKRPADMIGLSPLITGMSAAAAATGGGAAEVMAAWTRGTTAGHLAEENARLMILAMIQATKAGGELEPPARDSLMRHLDGIGAEELAFVKTALDAPLDPSALARETDTHTRAQVYAVSLATITADTEAERKYLDMLAGALGLDAETRAEVHRKMGVPLE